jgi:WD40 repeat protein
VLYSGVDGDAYAIIEWKLAEGREATVTRRLLRHINGVRGISVSPCATWMASTSEDKTVRVWDLVMGEQIRELKGHIRVVSDVMWLCDGKMIVSRSFDAIVRVWEVDAQVRAWMNLLFSCFVLSLHGLERDLCSLQLVYMLYVCAQYGCIKSCVLTCAHVEKKMSHGCW